RCGPAGLALSGAIRQTRSPFRAATGCRSYGRLGWLFVSPHRHRWHHSDDPAMAGRNFANMLAVRDVLGGTWTAPERQPESFGIRGEKMPEGFLRQMVAPFVDVARGTGRGGLRAADSPNQ